VVQQHGGRVVDHVVSEIGRNPIYELDYEGRRLALVHPGVGAPLAAGFLEELIARGCRAFVACGGAGGLGPDVALGHVIVRTSVAGTGTSRDARSSSASRPKRSCASHLPGERPPFGKLRPCRDRTSSRLRTSAVG